MQICISYKIWHNYNFSLHSYHAGKFGQSRIRKIRETIPSVSGVLERLYKSPNDTTLGRVCRNLVVNLILLLQWITSESY